jgi:hypothetical protein
LIGDVLGCCVAGRNSANDEHVAARRAEEEHSVGSLRDLVSCCIAVGGESFSFGYFLRAGRMGYSSLYPADWYLEDANGFT